MKPIDYVIIGLAVAFVAGVIAYTVRRKKSGKGGCGCGCSGCTNAACPSKQASDGEQNRARNAD